MIKPKRNIPLSTITRKLDSLVSQYVRARDGRCVVCGSTDNLQCGHFISRVFINTRWDLRNCNAQCAACNRYHELDVVPYMRAMEQIHGRQIIDELSELAHRTKVLKRIERLALIEDMKTKLAGIEK